MLQPAQSLLLITVQIARMEEQLRVAKISLQGLREVLFSTLCSPWELSTGLAPGLDSVFVSQAENDVHEEQAVGVQECVAVAAGGHEFQLRFAWESQQGTYPSKPNWKNQDALLVKTRQ